jgi:hypothetical protein
VGTSGADLAFASPPSRKFTSECQILNSTRNMNLLMVLLILTFAKATAEKECEC